MISKCKVGSTARPNTMFCKAKQLYKSLRTVSVDISGLFTAVNAAGTPDGRPLYFISRPYSCRQLRTELALRLHDSNMCTHSRVRRERARLLRLTGNDHWQEVTVPRCRVLRGRGFLTKNMNWFVFCWFFGFLEQNFHSKKSFKTSFKPSNSKAETP